MSGCCIESHIEYKNIFLRNTGAYSIDNWHTHFRNWTPTAAYVCAAYVAVRRCVSECCIEPYSGCTKTPFEQDWTPRPDYRTRITRVSTGPSSLRIQLVADVWLLMSGCCIERYRGFTKTPDPIPWRTGLACAFSESYTSRTRCYETSQFVCTADGDCTMLYVRVLCRTIHRV